MRAASPDNERGRSAMRADTELLRDARALFARMSRYRYSYNFTWLGRPIIQFPQDLIALQEIVWAVKPDLIVETGIAHGGSLIFWASLLELIGRDGRVIGIDVDIRPHNRVQIEQHPLAKRIEMLEGSSTDPRVVERVRAAAAGSASVMVVLDSNHTHDHVLAELHAYSSLVTRGSYLVVCDTIIEEMPADFSVGRPWGVGNNPRTALARFLEENDRFQVDAEIEGKLVLTVAPSGYLRCVKD